MSTIPGSLSTVAYNWDRENCPPYGVAGCLLFRDCLSIEVSERTVRTFKIVRWVSAVEGCPSTRVPVYDKDQVTADTTNSTSERVGIGWSLAEASRQCCLYVACLSLLCQGSKWLSGKSG